MTGSRGQIGCGLVSSLRQLGFKVYELDCLPESSPWYFQCDLVNDDLEFLRKLAVDVVVHLAGDKSDPPGSAAAIMAALHTNVHATVRIAEFLAKKVNQIIYASSISVYGDAPVPYQEDQQLMPRTLYGASKVCAEAYLSCYRQSTAICILRIAQVYGPQTPQHVAPERMMDSVTDGKVRLTCTEKTVRDYVHVEDVSSAIVSAIQRETCGIFNIGSGRPTSLLALASFIAESSGAVLEQVPSKGPEYAIWMLIEKAQKYLHYQPVWTIEEWVRKQMQRNEEMRCRMDS